MRRILVAGLLSAALPAGAAEISSSVTVTTDYVYRGVSQTRGGPALQAGVEAAWDGGLYLAGWASNVEFGPGDDSRLEVDVQAGWARELGEAWDLDVALAGYFYPEEPATNYGELLVRAERRERLILSGGWSHDALAAGSPGLYAAAGLRFELRRGWTLETLAGHSFIDAIPGGGYSHAEVRLLRSWGRFELAVEAHATSSPGRRAFEDEADPRLVGSGTWTFGAGE